MKLLCTFIITLIGTVCFAQHNVEWDKKQFKDNKKEFKDAYDKYMEGDAYFSGQVSGFPQYKQALPLFLEANEFNPNNADLNYKIGLCYLQSNDKIKALEYLKKAEKLKPTVHPDIKFFIAMAYQIQYKFEEALESLEAYRGKLKAGPDTERIMAYEKKKKECKSAIELMKKPVRVWIDGLGNVNSPYAEYSAFISADEAVMLYTARRPDTKGGDIDPQDNQYFEDIYISYKNKETNEWGPSENLGALNEKSHDATAGLSADGKTLFVYYGHKGSGDLYTSRFVDGEWTKPDDDAMKKNINTDYRESDATLSFDGKYLYFTSARDGSMGARDIFRSEWNAEKERWGEAVNIGPTVNTKYDETSLFFHPDGKTLYFSSKGHNSMGGFDIFTTVLQEDGTWTEPKNIGYPINTPDDDVFFVVSASGRHGYYSSFKQDGKGEKDLYIITFLGEEKPPQLNSEDPLIASIENPIEEIVVEPKVDMPNADVAILTGIVRDAKTLDPLGSQIELVDNEENEIIAEFTSDSKTGKFLVSLPSGKNYGVAVKAEGYLFHSENFNIPKSSGYKQYELNIDLKKLEVGQSIVLKNIFFDLDKYSLRPESKNELERLTQLMRDYPNMKIEISGHTDIRGNDSYNQKLSENRAKAVVDYLIDKGIAKDRMEYAGYGEEQNVVSEAEINKMDSAKEKEEAHQKNRRTEFKILSL